MENLTAIFFDLDDTLLDEAGSVTVALEATCRYAAQCLGADSWQTLAETRQRISDEFWRDFDSMGRGLGIAGARQHIWRSTLTVLGYRCDDSTVERIAEHYGVQRRQHCWLPDARQTLLTLRGRYRLGLITNGPTDLQREKIQALGVDELCQVTLVSEECGRSKPHPDIFERAMRALGVVPAQSLMVGDRADVDIVGAHGVGMRAVWVCPNGSPWPLAGTPAPWRTIRSVGELPALLYREWGWGE